MADVLALQQKLGSERVNRELTEYYSLFDNKKEGEGSEENEKKRKENYQKLVVNFHDLVTDFYEYGWGESFHFGPRHRLESFAQSLARYELYCALRLNLKPGMKAIDIGAGVGGPMREIARFSGANVVGLNINEYQIQRGRLHNKRDGMENLCDFMKGDFMNIPASDDSFDAAFEIEATCHAPSKDGCYSEIYRILKPGAMFSGYEWCITDKYDPKNAEHKKIKYGIEVGNGLPELVSTKEVADALRRVGFEIIELTDFGIPTEQNPIPWYNSLAGQMSLSGFRFTRVGRWCTAKFVYALETVRFAPKGSLETALMLNATAEDLVKGGQLQIFTPSYFFLAKKPENGKGSKKNH